MIQNFEADVKDKASIYVPAIGKVTIVILLRNLLVRHPKSPSRARANFDSATCPKQGNEIAERRGSPRGTRLRFMDISNHPWPEKEAPRVLDPIIRSETDESHHGCAGSSGRTFPWDEILIESRLYAIVYLVNIWWRVHCILDVVIVSCLQIIQLWAGADQAMFIH